jgi:hypothetical protein
MAIEIHTYLFISRNAMFIRWMMSSASLPANRWFVLVAVARHGSVFRR